MSKKSYCFGGLIQVVISSVLLMSCMAFADSGRNPFVKPAVSTSEMIYPDGREKKAPSSGTGKIAVATIPVQYATTDQILQVIQNKAHKGLLSAEGSMTTDARTNTIIIRDYPAYIKGVQSVIHTIDIPVRQVLIEARIVTMSESGLDELGIRWGEQIKQGHINIGGSVEQIMSGESDQTNIANYLNVSLPASSGNAASVAFQVARLGAGTLLDLELSALQSESKAEVISSPRLLTTNRQPAFIEQGTEIPYLESDSDGDSSVAFKKAVLSLKVTPNITPDHHVILDLNVTQDRPGEVVKTGTGEAVAIITQRIGTRVLVNDGETVVLGGIHQKTMTKTVDKVPMLGDLPLLGSLFRRTYQKTGKNELLIFVTPQVMIQ
ncbi:type IV pilus secretin PilQ [Vibrio quintilis]|uniref:Type IV pilus biogenesis and competence protein PilQ n=1 Tax=Vibrio quintilis TaxID=1117707 RepID=A0A1M7YQ65_9VIBR|nr:Type IV pilus biogenesis and competence protein PilQ precursor [Vibrio quintilis]